MTLTCKLPTLNKELIIIIHFANNDHLKIYNNARNSIK